ncbi:uncharacterized protein TRUGW13939_01321 [Talaromyces rugulosus]|uniref:2EXR domain-containing protein n=1 Tax=Talaromyces rugulosus TaxID=121627 RepID=A0A7H8QK13_TALRU|nr:uncharacterized protein TRUGW13939_01321 [Talaromyces rugulosus]QKX54236.1 hypothetical protein TRUGW13939_01321 [Talaromyces rugulosus]
MFHIFSALPAELRLYIWRLSLVHVEPVVGISCVRGVHPTSRRFARLFRASRENPPQLRVSCEARNEALRVYSPYFATEYVPNSRIYLAPDRDIVRLPDSLLGYLGPAELTAIRRLTVQINDYMFFGAYWMEVMWKLSNLIELELVVVLNLPVYTISDDLLQATGLDDTETHSLAKLKQAFVESARTNPEWKLPRIMVTSDSGKAIGEVTVLPEDIEQPDGQ